MIQKELAGCVLVLTVSTLGPMGLALVLMIRNNDADRHKSCPDCNQPADLGDIYCRACGYRFVPSHKTIARSEQRRTSTHPFRTSSPPTQQKRRKISALSYLLAVALTLMFGFATLNLSGNLQNLAPQRTTSIIPSSPTPTRRTARTYPVRTTQTSTPIPTPIPTPTSTRKPTAIPTSVIKTLKYSNVRTGPGTNYPVLTQVAQNQTVNPNGRNADGSWIRIEVNSTVGWIWAPLTTMQDIMTLSTVAIPPVPSKPEITNTPTTPPTPTDIFYPGYCYELIPQGVVPKGGWTRDNINYTSSRDGDNDGRACEN